MARGRNSKSAVLRDNHREKRVRELDAAALDAAAAVIERRFTGEHELTGQLDSLAGMIRDGTADRSALLDFPGGGR